jgi:hypothetical protein
MTPIARIAIETLPSTPLPDTVFLDKPKELRASILMTVGALAS